MRIFDFTLMNGYEFSGVDVAQGFRAKLFKKNNIDIKYCFMNLPTQRDLDLYINQGIDREQIISKEIYLTGRMDMRLSLKKDILLSKEIIDHDDIIEKDNITYLIENNKKKCEIICDDENNIIRIASIVFIIDRVGNKADGRVGGTRQQAGEPPFVGCPGG